MARLLVAFLLSLFAGLANAAVIFTATLSGPAEAPPNASPGTGTALVTYDAVTHLLTVNVDFSGLLGPTTVAHIHCCVDAPGAVGVATYPGTFPGFPVGVTSGVYSSSWFLDVGVSYTPAFITNFGGGTTAGAEAALVAGMIAGRAYVNVHSQQFPGGEIRGFLRVPEPSTLALLGLALAGLALRRRALH